jgi:cellulose synthase operon protein YhjQ
LPLICIASPKGGVGKTTLSANLAELLRRDGRTVVALDLDPQNSLRLHFGVPVAEQEGFAAQLAQRPSWRACLRQSAAGTLLLPHGSVTLRAALDSALALENDPELLAAPLREMLADPRVTVVADMPPGPSQALQIMAPMADLLVTVLRSEAISAAMLAEIEAGRFLGTGTMKALFAGRLQFVLNAVDLRERLSRATAEAVARHLGSRLLGAVSQDEAVGGALASQRLLVDAEPDSRAARDLRQIATAIGALLAANTTTTPRQEQPATAATWAAPQWGTH